MLSSSSLSLSAIDEATLEYMVNEYQYEKYLKKHSIEHNSTFQSDVKFYRRRILAHIKHMLKGKGNGAQTEIAFNVFLKLCISNFKFIDESDALQQKYDGISGDDAADAADAADADIASIEDANKLCFKHKETKQLTIDKLANFNIKPPSSATPIPPISFPKMQFVDLKDPIFKTKGCKTKGC